MPEMSVSNVIYLIAVGSFTGMAAYTDLRERKVRNRLVVPFFAAGLVYHPVFNGWAGLGHALLGFAVGFGLFFALWLIGVGGGGDTKLMGALGAWLGWKHILLVMVVATVIVILLTIALMLYRAFTGGAAKMALQAAEADGGRTSKAQKKKKKMSHEERIADKQRRRLMAFALPVALATWLVVALDVWKLLPARFQ